MWARAQRRSAGVPEDPTSGEAARRVGLILLGRRDYPCAELLAKLIEKGYTCTAAAEAVAALLEERLLNDARYLENFIRAHSARGRGPLRIRKDLQGRGFKAEEIEPALASGPDFLSICRTLRTRKFGAGPPASWAEKGRQARFLQYRGFSSDHIQIVTGQDPDITE
ncbi:MAG: regulatory protein RecX [Gammaproteobacteria bacterium]|nr:regulatory protein RecX [Gammaproteobacteria bacterium]